MSETENAVPLPAARKIVLEDWLAAMTEMAREVATTSLGFDGCERQGVRQELPADSAGSYIPVVSPDNSIQIALVATAGDCMRLAQALLGSGPDEGDLSPGDLADAVGEIINIMAGGVKRILRGQDAALALGLPIFIYGHVQSTAVLEYTIADITLGPIPAMFVVLRHRVRESRTVLAQPAAAAGVPA